MRTAGKIFDCVALAVVIGIACAALAKFVS